MSEKIPILVVDDDNDILDLFEMFLYKDFDVTTAVNGFEGLKKVKEKPPCCVITDIMMPIMDGIKFISRFRKIEGMEKVPVIAVTAFSSNLQEQSLTSVGFAKLIAKPVSQQVLISTVQSVMEKR